MTPRISPPTPAVPPVALAALGLRSGKASVPRGHPSKPALARPQFRPWAVLDPLDFELRVLVAERAVTANTLRHFHGGRTGRCYSEDVLLKGCWVRAGPG